MGCCRAMEYTGLGPVRGVRRPGLSCITRKVKVETYSIMWKHYPHTVGVSYPNKQLHASSFIQMTCTRKYVLVLSKLRPRYKAVQKPNKPQGDLDVDFQNPFHRDPDTLDLMEDEFGARVQLECLLHETLEEQVMANGNVVGRARDSFVLFRVVQISSNEHYSGEPTLLKTAEGMWKMADDRLLWDNQTGKGQTRTNSQMAELFGKEEREVELRRRFLKRLHRDDEGYPVTPKQLR